MRCVMIGGTGAVGSATIEALLQMPELDGLTLLGRRETGFADARVSEHVVDMLDPATYRHYLADYDTAICTLGVGEPTKMPNDEFKRIDHYIPIAFATACKEAGIEHFELLGSIGASSSSRSFFLRTKGELEEAIVALGFRQVSFFQPSMILTPTNRYGLSQALTLAVWPKLTPLLIGPLRKLRGVPVTTLGQAIATRALSENTGVYRLRWDDFRE